MLTWYLARGAGVAAFATFSVATAAGAITTRRRADVQARVILQYVHRAASLAGLLLLALHIALLVADSYADVGVIGALVPLGSGYRPLAVSLGVLATYAMVGVAVTGLLRSRFARSDKAVRAWRYLHLASYGSWALAASHFLTAGTDTGKGWARLVLLAGVAVVGAGIAVRLSEPATTPMATGARR